MADAASIAWQNALDLSNAALSPRFGPRLQMTTDPAAVPATHFLRPDYLHPMVLRTLADPPPRTGESPRAAALVFTIAASRFAWSYALPFVGLALTGLAHGVGLDLSLARCRVLPVTENGRTRLRVSLGAGPVDVVRCRERPTSWAIDGRSLSTISELREFVWAKLFGENLAPVLNLVHQVGRVSERFLWTSVAEIVALISDEAAQNLDAATSARYIADSRALLLATTLPGLAGPNPLHGMVEWCSADGPRGRIDVRTRRLCCLSYLLDVRDGSLCQSCPHLPLPDRVALADEERVDVPGSPAAARAREIGRQRRAFQRARADQAQK
jgi:hypothetical protein